MAEEVKKDVKLLLILALALSLFNVISVQFYLFGISGGYLSNDFGEKILPTEGIQKDSTVVSATSDQKTTERDKTESHVLKYVNDKLRRYGYGVFDSTTQEGGSFRRSSEASDSSTTRLQSDEEENLDESSEGSSNEMESASYTNANSNSNAASSQTYNQNEGSDQSQNRPGEQSQDSQPDSGLPSVPPNENGPPAQPVKGSISFGIKSGLG